MTTKECKHRWEQVWPGTFQCSKCEGYAHVNKFEDCTTPSLGQSITATFKQNHNITFQNSERKQVGRLDFNGDYMTFEGDADESAKVFIEAMAHWFAVRIDEENEACAKVCENYQDHCTGAAIADAIRARRKR